MNNLTTQELFIIILILLIRINNHIAQVLFILILILRVRMKQNKVASELFISIRFSFSFVTGNSARVTVPNRNA